MPAPDRAHTVPPSPIAPARSAPVRAAAPDAPRRPRAALGWLAFPSLLTGVTAGAAALLARGAPLPLVSASGLVVAALLVLGLERVAPLHRSWNQRPDRLDLLLLAGNRIIDVAVLGGTVALLGALEAADAPLALLRVWPERLPLPLSAALGIVLAEAVRYLMHRLSHRPGWLGRVHVTHHAPTRMYALNGPRLHPGNHLWIAIANVAPMLLLGARLEAVVLAMVVTSVFVLFQHANLDLTFVGWNRIFATPDVHRLHHVRRPPAGGVNYGIVLLVFDQIFGTYQAAGERPGADEIGLLPRPPSR